VYDVELPITKGLQCILYCFSHKVPCKIAQLDSIVDQSKNNEVIKLKPKILKKGVMSIVTILLEQRICLELQENNKAMGRIALRDGNKTIAAGIVTQFIR
jgi:translation elongation factor EF-1alpha|tara:strand:- start:44 stop:343 length:300 start_codon:yes stop_codon:yes gene_type:complete